MEHLLGFIQPAIHRNKRISNIDKFNYLNSAINWSSSNSSYPRPYIDRGKLRSHSQIVTVGKFLAKPNQPNPAHIWIFFLNVSPCSKDHSSILRYVYNQICVHYSSMALLSVSADHYSLTHSLNHLISKCPLAHRASSGSIWKSLNSNHYVQIAIWD